MEIPIDDIEEGQVLTQPIMNNYGQILLPSGATISSRHINLLKTWNIESIHVGNENDSEEEKEEEFGDEVLKHANKRLKGRLNWIPENELEQELYNIGIRRACEIIGKAQTR